MFNDKLKIVKYQFTLKAVDKITLPAYKDSTLHGGFGHALKKISPIWYRYFFESGLDQKDDWPTPCVHNWMHQQTPNVSTDNNPTVRIL